MTLQTNQPVKTPNGVGIFQFPTWGNGQKWYAVAHKPDAQIDESKCGFIQKAGGIWILAGYTPDQVEAV